ncbi:MAG: sigma-70 family RNA polymerase sigma factor [Clostridia bacterium]|nr:sigma-70 family RNA polymerase sigma factor [Clostridia bacterium]NCC43151.1 sigma-70 family RNA polymerase sigma factor [Clostridia bacterium]
MNTKEKKECEKIYEENKERLKWFLLKHYGWMDNDDIFDIMQETWKSLSENIKKVSPWEEKSQFAWLVTVAKNRAIDMMRYSDRKNKLDEKVQNLYDTEYRTPQNPVQDIAVERATALDIMSKLSRKEREALFGEDSNVPTSDAKEVRDNSSVCKTYRARKKLRKHMKEGGMDE